jgi:hypothetical protein
MPTLRSQIYLHIYVQSIFELIILQLVSMLRFGKTSGELEMKELTHFINAFLMEKHDSHHTRWQMLNQSNLRRRYE